MIRENTVNVPTQSLCDWDAFEDDISDVINDSIDMDWNSLHGARAVLDWLNGKAPYAAPLHEGEGEPRDGEVRVMENGNVCRFIERELEGDKWEVLGALYTGPAAPPPSVEVFGSSPDGDTPRVAETAVVGDLIRELVEACQPIAEKARRWDERHGSSRRDSVQIEHRIGDFRRIRDLLDHKSCADGAPR